MKLIDVSVPLDAPLPTSPHNTPTLVPVKRVARRDSSNVSTPHMSAHTGTYESGAKHLVEHGIRVVGGDCLPVEVFKTPGAPAHHVLLGSGTVVIEGLDLPLAEAGVYDMFCLPLRVVGSDGAPARVVLRRS